MGSLERYFKPLNPKAKHAAVAAPPLQAGSRGSISQRPAATPGGGSSRKRRRNVTSFISQTGHEAACKKWDAAAKRLVRGSTVPALTGRVLMTVVDRATPLAFCSENEVMTLCGCSMAMRFTQRRGDILLWVSSEKPRQARRARGLRTSQRLVLRTCISSGSLTVPQYMANMHGRLSGLTTRRSDKIYMVQPGPAVVEPGMPTLRHPFSVFLHLTASMTLARAAVAAAKSDDEWRVTYTGVDPKFSTVVFKRKAGSKYQRLHTLHGRNVVTNTRRRSDFLGRVIVSHNFVQFPSDEDSSEAITWRSLKVSNIDLGRGLRTTTLKAQPALAAFIYRLWPAAAPAGAASAPSTSAAR